MQLAIAEVLYILPGIILNSEDEIDKD